MMSFADLSHTIIIDECVSNDWYAVLREGVPVLLHGSDVTRAGAEKHPDVIGFKLSPTGQFNGCVSIGLSERLPLIDLSTLPVVDPPWDAAAAHRALSSVSSALAMAPGFPVLSSVCAAIREQLLHAEAWLRHLVRVAK